VPHATAAKIGEKGTEEEGKGERDMYGSGRPGQGVSYIYIYMNIYGTP